jgi:hypothetical protein
MVACGGRCCGAWAGREARVVGACLEPSWAFVGTMARWTVGSRRLGTTIGALTIVLSGRLLSQIGVGRRWLVSGTRIDARLRASGDVDGSQGFIGASHCLIRLDPVADPRSQLRTRIEGGVHLVEGV